MEPKNYEKMSSKTRAETRHMYVAEQKGLCHYCRSPLEGHPSQCSKDMAVTPALYPNGFFDNPVHLHHCHQTGMTIGAVHARCNAVLWEHRGE